jgi:hypothetical protein
MNMLASVVSSHETDSFDVRMVAYTVDSGNGAMNHVEDAIR